MGNAEAKEKELEQERLKREQEEIIKAREKEREEKRKTRDLREAALFKKRCREVEHFWLFIRVSPTLQLQEKGRETTNITIKRSSLLQEDDKSSLYLLPRNKTETIAVRASPEESVSDLKRQIIHALPSSILHNNKGISVQDIYLTLPFHGRGGGKREVIGRSNSDSDVEDDDLLLSDTPLVDISISWRVLTLWKGSTPPSEEGNLHEIFIESTATGITIPIKVYLDESISALKAVIRDEEGTPTHQQYLFNGNTGAKLDDEQFSLLNSGVTPGCTLVLTRIRGQGDLAIAVISRRERLRKLGMNDSEILNDAEKELLQSSSNMLDVKFVLSSPLSKDWSHMITRLMILSALSKGEAPERRMTTITNRDSNLSTSTPMFSITSGPRRTSGTSKVASAIRRTSNWVSSISSSIQKKASTLKQPRQSITSSSRHNSQADRTSSPVSILGKIGIGSNEDGFVFVSAPPSAMPGWVFEVDFIIYTPKLKPLNPEYSMNLKNEKISTGLGPIAVDGYLRLALDMPHEHFQILDSDSVHDVPWDGHGFRRTSFHIRTLQKNHDGQVQCRAKVYINGEARCVLCFTIKIDSHQEHFSCVPVEVPGSLTLIPPCNILSLADEDKRVDSFDETLLSRQDPNDVAATSMASPTQNDGDEYDIYVSHRRDQRPIVVKLKQVLEEKYGYRVYAGVRARPITVKGLSTPGSFINVVDKTELSVPRASNADETDNKLGLLSKLVGKREGKIMLPDPDESELLLENEDILRKCPIVLSLVSKKPSGSVKQRLNMSSFAAVKYCFENDQPDRILKELEISANLGKIVLFFHTDDEIDMGKEVSYLPESISSQFIDPQQIHLSLSLEYLAEVSSNPNTSTPISFDLGSLESFHQNLQASCIIAINQRTSEQKDYVKKRWAQLVIKERKLRVRARANTRLEVWDLDPRCPSDIVSRVFEEAGVDEALALVRAGAESRHDVLAADTLEEIANSIKLTERDVAISLYKSSRRIRLLIQGSSHPAVAANLEMLALVEASGEQRIEMLEKNAELIAEKKSDSLSPQLALAWDVASKAVFSTNPSHAVVLRKKALDAWRTALGHMHPVVLNFAFALSKEMVEARRISEAQELLDDTINGESARLGRTHPLTIATSKYLDSVNKEFGTEKSMRKPELQEEEEEEEEEQQQENENNIKQVANSPKPEPLLSKSPKSETFTSKSPKLEPLNATLLHSSPED